jgi:hypothetical protein
MTVTGYKKLSGRYLIRERNRKTDMLTASTGGLAKKIALFHGPGTRQWPRSNMTDLPSGLAVFSSAGAEIPAVNISRGGVLLRTRLRLAKGTKMQLHLKIAGDDIPLSGIVVRSCVSSSKRLPRFETALVFNSILPAFDGKSDSSADAPKPAVLQFPPFGLAFVLEEMSRECPPDTGSSMIAGFLALKVSAGHGAELREMPALNDW